MKCFSYRTSQHTDVVKELYDVGVLAGVIRPMAVGFKTDEVKRYLSFPELPEPGQ